jgi:hypothetical protein
LACQGLLHDCKSLDCRYKQQGQAAVEADNVFHHLTYGGGGDGAARSGASARERAALEMQINEFGQCPRQIFRSPHAPRLVCPPVQLPGARGQQLFNVFLLSFKDFYIRSKKVLNFLKNYSKMFLKTEHFI